MTVDEQSDVKSKEDWSWFVLDPRIKPRWVPEGDGSYELQALVCELRMSNK